MRRDLRTEGGRYGCDPVEKVKFPHDRCVDETIANICSEIEQMMGRHGLDCVRTRARSGSVAAGPLDSRSEAWSCRRLTCPGGTTSRSSGCFEERFRDPDGNP